MRILFIRHGDPDYVNDTVTERGRAEAQALAAIAETLNIDDCYVSPLGRAQATAQPVLQVLGKEAITLPWLREFKSDVDIRNHPEFLKAYPDTRMENGQPTSHGAWDLVPSYYATHPEYLDPNAWRMSELAKITDVVEEYDRVCGEFDRLLATYGYVRSGMYYRVEKENDVTLALFCHMGVSLALLSHLWNISPYVAWHSFFLAPSSVTEIVSEEREQGIAYFKTVRMSDTFHLARLSLVPSFSGRFTEVYSDFDTRH